ncbi:MAG: glycoside hydrolase family 2 TIM barrel-domain containing protein [bacterium]
MKKYISLMYLFTVIIFTNFNQTAQVGTLEATLSIEEDLGEYIPFQNGMIVPSFEKQKREMINLAGTWKKQRFTADHDLSLLKRDDAGYAQLITEADGRHLPEYDDSAWEDKVIPGVENAMYEYPTVPEYYQDGVWYRYKFDVDNSFNDKFMKLIFYSVNYIADVWLNGEYLGYHEGGYTPFAFNVSNVIIPNGENVLAVRVDNIPWGKRKDIVPFYQCDWFNYAGIIHDIYLEATDNINVSRNDVVPQNIDGEISVRTIINNNLDIPSAIDILAEVFEADVNESNKQSEFAADLISSSVPVISQTESGFQLNTHVGIWNNIMNIPNPKLWTPSNPNLYVLKISLIQNQQVIDEFYTQFGVRTIKTVGDKVFLNDRVVFFTGIARHEDHPVYGRSIPKEIIYSDLNFIKSSNCNFLRTGHYPNHPYTYLIADRIGLPIMEEIPVWWFDTEEPWLIQNEQRHIHEQMFREMVLKDFNRPSILLWSTSNECKEETNRIIFNQWIKDDITQKYPDGRLISQSSAGDNPGHTDITQAPLDVAGWTLYFGIFHGDPLQSMNPAYFYAGTLKFLMDAHIAFPNKPIIDTEFGYWSSENGSSTEAQVEVFDNTFKAFKFFAPIYASGNYNPNGYVMATTWWCVYDWYSHQHQNGFQSMGLVSMDRLTNKPAYNSLVTAYEPYFNLGGMITSVEDEKGRGAIPVKFELMDNYPNPFNPTTTIKYSIPSNPPLSPFIKGGSGEAEGDLVTLIVYDILGREVATLVNEEQEPGLHEITFDASNMPSGIYFYRIQAGNFTSTKKMVLLK